jgi:hypothetical protein
MTLWAGAGVFGQPWYKSRVPLWVERYLIPICAAIVFGIVILNPLKFDWQQRLSLVIAISAFAYFLAHTVHRPKLGPDNRVAALEQQVRDLQNQQQQFLSQRQRSEAEEKQQTEIRTHLGKLITRGTKLRDNLREVIGDGTKTQTLAQQQAFVDGVQQWHSETVSYIKTIPRSDIYLARFESGVRGTSSYPNGIFQIQLGSWDLLMSDLAKLNEFITDPDLGKN